MPCARHPLALLWIISFTPLSKPVVLEVSLSLFTDDKTEAHGEEVPILGPRWYYMTETGFEVMIWDEECLPREQRDRILGIGTY